MSSSSNNAKSLHISGDVKSFNEKTVRPVRRYFRFLDSVRKQKLEEKITSGNLNSKVDPNKRGKFGWDELYVAGLSALQSVHQQVRVLLCYCAWLLNVISIKVSFLTYDIM